MTDKALKKWIGVPKSATNVVIHMKQTLGIKSISQTYTEMHKTIMFLLLTGHSLYEVTVILSVI